MRKTAFCICENKGTDQLRCNRTADQRLCFRYLRTSRDTLPTPLTRQAIEGDGGMRLGDLVSV